MRHFHDPTELDINGINPMDRTQPGEYFTFRCSVYNILGCPNKYYYQKALNQNNKPVILPGIATSIQKAQKL